MPSERRNRAEKPHSLLPLDRHQAGPKRLRQSPRSCPAATPHVGRTALAVRHCPGFTHRSAQVRQAPWRSGRPWRQHQAERLFYPCCPMVGDPLRRGACRLLRLSTLKHTFRSATGTYNDTYVVALPLALTTARSPINQTHKIAAERDYGESTAFLPFGTECRPTRCFFRNPAATVFTKAPLKQGMQTGMRTASRSRMFPLIEPGSRLLAKPATSGSGGIRPRHLIMIGTGIHIILLD